MPEITIYHNPRCSKSRAALAILTESGVKPDIIEYLKNPPDRATIEEILRLLGCDAEDIVRTGEAQYKELGFMDSKPSRDELISAMVEYPVLIQRPIVVKGKKAVLGRPPEKVKELL